MAKQIFKNWSVYTDNKKHGNASKATLDLPSGSESCVGDDGHLGVTQGKAISKLSLSEYVPIGGKAEQDAIYRAWKGKKPIHITCGPVLGKLLKIEMNVMNLKLDTDMVKGTSVMDVDLEGGVPDEAG